MRHPWAVTTSGEWGQYLTAQRGQPCNTTGSRWEAGSSPVQSSHSSSCPSSWAPWHPLLHCCLLPVSLCPVLCPSWVPGAYAACGRHSGARLQRGAVFALTQEAELKGWEWLVERSHGVEIGTAYLGAVLGEGPFALCCASEQGHGSGCAEEADLC